MAIARALCIQDISCVGRCSLTVVLPTLSAMGVQACPLPTAILSSHPLGFSPPVHTDETDFCLNTLNSYKQQEILFDAVLVGYLSNATQSQIAVEALSQNKTALKIIDPVMADHGKPYSRTTPELCSALQKLCLHGDILTPNLTESAMLLGLAANDDAMTNEEITLRLESLHKAYKNAKAIIITGVKNKNGTNGNAILQAFENKSPITHFLTYKTVNQSYPGTGDLFTAILSGSLLQGNTLTKSVENAANFITNAAMLTLQNGGEPRHGVNFEQILCTLSPKPALK